MKAIGSRAEVFHSNALKTPGGLHKKDLVRNKRGRIVSLKKSKTAKNWNPLKMMGLLSESGEGFGSRTYHKGSISKTRLGRSGQLVEDFVTHKGTTIKRNGKKYKAYNARKGSVRKTDKWKLGRDYMRGGISGMTSDLGYAQYPVPPAEGKMPDFTPQERALMAVGGRRGGNALAMTNLDSAYPSQLNNMVDMGVNSPFNRSLNAAI